MRSVAIVGSGPNGLAAAIVLQQAGFAVTIFEAADGVGGACRTEQITLPDFHHDLGSAVLPLGISSPFLENLPLADFGLRWIQPDAPLAHPLGDGKVAILERSLELTCRRLGPDGSRYRALLGPIVEHFQQLKPDLLGPLGFPSHPFQMASFGARALMPAAGLMELVFRQPEARALLGGIAAHSILPLTQPLSAAVAMVLGAAAHAVGWPIPAGGAGALTQAMARYFEYLGGTIHTSHRIAGLKELEAYDAIVCDVSARQLARLGGDQLPSAYRNQLEAFQYGPGLFKLDWALSQPIPWRAAECARAATVHLGGPLEEMIASEQAPWDGRVSATPYVLVTQPSLSDPTRAPAGRHTAWGYCHVPNGYREDLTEAIESRMEEFAPGFRDCVLARVASSPAELEAWNANLIGGDVSGGAMTAKQLLLRPTRTLYRTPLPKLFLCSASTPPGGGVHGMCGFHAAQKAIEYLHTL